MTIIHVKLAHMFRGLRPFNQEVIYPLSLRHLNGGLSPSWLIRRERWTSPFSLVALYSDFILKISGSDLGPVTGLVLFFIKYVYCVINYVSFVIHVCQLL
jgi:hypothetical protein